MTLIVINSALDDPKKQARKLLRYPFYEVADGEFIYKNAQHVEPDELKRLVKSSLGYRVLTNFAFKLTLNEDGMFHIPVMGGDVDRVAIVNLDDEAFGSRVIHSSISGRGIFFDFNRMVIIDVSNGNRSIKINPAVKEKEEMIVQVLSLKNTSDGL